MDQQKTEKFCCQSIAESPSSAAKSQCSNADSRQQPEVTTNDVVASRKVQKADREKLRRDRLNEQFSELGNALDADRPKNDKATILTDTIQLLKDLTSEVDRLRAECAALIDESRELTQEKNELREEKASLRSDIDNLNIQYHQRVRVMLPWGHGDPSVVMASPYSYPMTLAGPIPVHPPMQSYPYFGAQNHVAMPNPCSTFIPYHTPNNILAEQQSALHVSTSLASSKQDSISKSSDCPRKRQLEKGADSGPGGDVLTELELKTPGSSGQQEASSGNRKGKQTRKKEKPSTEPSASSGKLSSSRVHQESSSNSVGHSSNPDK